jgi:tetratricopeptide (TPR) repeat protein
VGLLAASFGSSRGGGAAYLIGAFAGLTGYALLRVFVLATTQDAAALYATTVWWLVAVALVATLGLRRASDGPAIRWPHALVYPVAGAAAVAAIFGLAVRPVQADIYFSSALANFGAALQNDDPDQFQVAQGLYDQAVGYNAAEPLYPMQWGELYMGLGQESGDMTALQAAFGRAQELLAAAERLDPQFPYYAYNRGHLQLVYAQMAPPEQQPTVAANAVVALKQAFDGAPSDVAIALELAQAQLLAGDTQAAKTMAEYVRSLDPQNPAPSLVIGRALASEGDIAGAQAAFEESLKGGAGSVETYVALGELAREQQDLGAARNWYSQAAEVAPDNWMVFFNLGLLYRDTGQTQEALAPLSRALGLAPETEKARVQQALDNLLTGGAAP